MPLDAPPPSLEPIPISTLIKQTLTVLILSWAILLIIFPPFDYTTFHDDSHVTKRPGYQTSTPRTPTPPPQPLPPPPPHPESIKPNSTYPQPRSSTPFDLPSELYESFEEDTTDSTFIPFPDPHTTYYRREYVRQMAMYAWDGYWDRCPGFDELEPLTGKCKSWLHNAATAIDSISLFLLMNDTVRYEQAVKVTDLIDVGLSKYHQETKFLKHFSQHNNTLQTDEDNTQNRFSTPSLHTPFRSYIKHLDALNSTQKTTEPDDFKRKVSFFETTIRVLGGFISQYDLTKDPKYLQSAINVADRLMPAFDNHHTGFPTTFIDFLTGIGENLGWCMDCYILADVATIQLEFCSLTSALYEYKHLEAVEFGLGDNGGNMGFPGYDDTYNVKDDFLKQERGFWGGDDMKIKAKETFLKNKISNLVGNSDTNETIKPRFGNEPFKFIHVYEPWEYCQRAHHVISTLYSLSYSKTGIQKSHLFPVKLFPSNLSPRDFLNNPNLDLGTKFQLLQNNGSGNVINNGKSNPKLDYSDFMQQHELFYAPLRLPVDNEMVNSISQNLSDTYQSQWKNQEKNMNKINNFEHKNGFYTNLLGHESQNAFLPFDIRTFIMSIHAHNQTNTPLPQFYNEIAEEWVQLLYMDQNERQKYHKLTEILSKRKEFFQQISNSIRNDKQEPRPEKKQKSVIPFNLTQTNISTTNLQVPAELLLTGELTPAEEDLIIQYGSNVKRFRSDQMKLLNLTYATYSGLELTQYFIDSIYDKVGRERIGGKKSLRVGYDGIAEKIDRFVEQFGQNDDQNGQNGQNGQNNKPNQIDAFENALQYPNNPIKTNLKSLFDLYHNPTPELSDIMENYVNETLVVESDEDLALLSSLLPPDSQDFVHLPLPDTTHHIFSQSNIFLKDIDNWYTVGVGPMSDSTYEYFLKTWIITGKTNQIYLDLFLKSTKTILDNIYQEIEPNKNITDVLKYSRHLNRFFTKKSHKKYHVGAYKYPRAGAPNGFHRFDNVNHSEFIFETQLQKDNRIRREQFVVFQKELEEKKIREKLEKEMAEEEKLKTGLENDSSDRIGIGIPNLTLSAADLERHKKMLELIFGKIDPQRVPEPNTVSQQVEQNPITSTSQIEDEPDQIEPSVYFREHFSKLYPSYDFIHSRETEWLGASNTTTSFADTAWLSSEDRELIKTYYEDIEPKNAENFPNLKNQKPPSSILFSNSHNRTNPYHVSQTPSQYTPLPHIASLINPKLHNRVIKWVFSQPYSYLVDHQVESTTNFMRIQQSSGNSVMHHLSCFYPGTLALALIHNAIPQDEINTTLYKAESLARGCVSGYLLSQVSGLAPQEYLFQDGTLHFGVDNYSDSGFNFNLRPETIESLYLLYRYTGNQVYRELIWLITASIERFCKVKYGYANLKDVREKEQFEDRQETFLFAEVLKYSFLAFEEGFDEPVDDMLFKIQVPYDLDFNKSGRGGDGKDNNNPPNTAPHPIPIISTQDHNPNYQRLSESNFMNQENIVYGNNSKDILGKSTRSIVGETVTKTPSDSSHKKTRYSRAVTQHYAIASEFIVPDSLVDSYKNAVKDDRGNRKPTSTKNNLNNKIPPKNTDTHINEQKSTSKLAAPPTQKDKQHRLFDLTKYVFNTEAHPIEIRRFNIDYMLYGTAQ
jgi:hypothetical protein